MGLLTFLLVIVIIFDIVGLVRAGDMAKVCKHMLAIMQLEGEA
jgi:hypothetical protein